ncbi:MAG: type II/IV secretion system ATPase subunit [Candidatus Bathyarchaeota archaeon]|nr:type II/IV secretion system ATPase subunit [Candidatus Bathyarchaeota archaeon]
MNSKKSLTKKNGRITAHKTRSLTHKLYAKSENVTVKSTKTKTSGLFLKKNKKQPLSIKATAIFKELPQTAQTVEVYPVEEAFSKITIASLPELGGGKAYFIDEIRLSDEEKAFLFTLNEMISKELEPPKNMVDAKSHVAQEALRLATKYGLNKKISSESWSKIQHYLYRNLIGFGDIDVIMKDPQIEDISVNGVDLPVYVWHRKYESIPTNLVFTDEVALDNLIVKLTHMANKHISTAFPLLDAMLPGKDRLAATFKREVSPKGGSFSIRRFREEPFSIIDLIELGTINEEIAAYFWLLIENRMTLAVIGGTGAGKTSTLNAVASLVKPSMKIVTVEEIPELNLPHENWVQLVSRESYGLGTIKTGEVALFHLVKTALRYRPDYIVVGEIRGEEAFVLFQALATGHGGLTTLHADSIDYAIKRLTSPPMNVAETYMPLINVTALVERQQLPTKSASGASFGRRITSIAEVEEFEKYNTISQWNPTKDVFNVNLQNSVILQKIAVRQGVTKQDLLKEIAARAKFLHKMKENGIKNNTELAKRVTAHRSNKESPASDAEMIPLIPVEVELIK